jgi:release factor glutamine methyltransferase
VHKAYLSDESVNSVQASRIIDISLDLKSGKPIQYILGETTFYDCIIKLNGSTLIPRQETEELVDQVISDNRGYAGNIIDFGTGSGCIAIALASNLSGSRVTGTDISDEALKIAGENAILNNVKITLIKDDMLDPDCSQFGKAGIIVSNPPYVRKSEIKDMNKNVVEFEPHAALFVEDTDPLVYYNCILQKADRILDPGGRIYFEINEMLGKEMVQLLESYGYRDLHTVRDINGKDRIIKGTKHGGQ